MFWGWGEERKELEWNREVASLALDSLANVKPYATVGYGVQYLYKYYL